MKRGFTLVELLAIIVVLGIIGVISTPIIQGTLKDNKEKAYKTFEKQIIDYTKDYFAKDSLNFFGESVSLPNDPNNPVTVKFEDLKKAGVLTINVANPKTGKLISNQSTVTVAKKNGYNNYTYNVVVYDLENGNDIDNTSSSIALNSHRQNVNIGDEYDLESFEGVSRQIVLNGREVSTIDTSTEGLYEVYYSKLVNGNLDVAYKIVEVK